MFTKLAKMLSSMRRKEEGFTLIELLIVVAIIAILAAIAIPQFSAYRIRGYNSAAVADLRNAKTAAEAFFSDWQAYSSSVGAVAPPCAAGANGTPGVGIVMSSTTNCVGLSAGAIAAGPPALPSSASTFTTGISQNVGLSVNTSANGGSYTIASKNQAGDRCYGTDSDATAIYWVNGPIGLILLAGSNPVATANADNFNAVAGAANCDGTLGGGAGGQITWTTL